MTDSTKTVGPLHCELYSELVAVLRKYMSKMPADECLAISANLTGKVIAMQDQRTMTPEMAMEIVIRNVRLGNREMIDELLNAPGGNA